MAAYSIESGHNQRHLRNLSTMLRDSLSRALTNLVKLCETSISALVLMSHYFEKNALHGGFQLLDLITTELKSHMTCLFYNRSCDFYALL